MQQKNIMMYDRSVFHLISDIFKEKDVSCILIGGFAVNHYRVTRQTLDIDFLITEEDFEKIFGLLAKEGYRKEFSHANFAHCKSGQIQFMDIDFMFVDKETLAKIKKESESLEIVDQRFRVPSLYHLIALKLHSIKNNPKLRLFKDMPDIIQLVRINKVPVTEKKFKDICLKYGTSDLYEKILEAAK